MTTPPRPVGCLLIAIGLGLLLLIALLVVPDVGAQPIHGSRPGLDWWAWQSEACPIVQTLPPGRGLAFCGDGWVTVNVTTPYHAVWVDGEPLVRATWLPMVGR